MFDWKKIVTTLLTLLAAQGGWLAAVAALIRDYLLPLIGDEKLSAQFATDATAAPPEFKTAVREYLLALVAKVQRPLIRVILRQLIATVSDTLLDTLYDMIVGGKPLLMAAVPGDVIAEAALEDLKRE